MAWNSSAGLPVRGERVVAACRHPGRATALNLLAGEHPGRLHVLPLDVVEARSRDELVRELPLVLDGARLGLLVNNAGVLHGGERFGRSPRSTWRPACTPMRPALSC